MLMLPANQIAEISQVMTGLLELEDLNCFHRSQKQKERVKVAKLL